MADEDHSSSKKIEAARQSVDFAFHNTSQMIAIDQLIQARVEQGIEDWMKKWDTYNREQLRAMTEEAERARDAFKRADG